jgi:hypothetical protein
MLCSCCLSLNIFENELLVLIFGEVKEHTRCNIWGNGLCCGKAIILVISYEIYIAQMISMLAV